MKFYHSFFLYIILMSFVSCTKDRALLDFRDELTGVYQGQRIVITRIHSNNSYNYDTVLMNFDITKDLTTNQGIIFQSDTFQIDVNGHYSDYGIGTPIFSDLDLRNDSLLYHHFWSSPGGWIETYIKAVK